jgi:hypothetical protein
VSEQCTITRQFARGSLGARRLETEVARVLEEAARTGGGHAGLSTTGDDPHEFHEPAEAGGQLPERSSSGPWTGADLRDVAVLVRENGQGIDPQLVEVTVSLAVSVASGITVKALTSIWEKVILPSLQRRHGHDVLGDPIEGKTDRASDDGDASEGSEPQ